MLQNFMKNINGKNMLFSNYFTLAILLPLPESFRVLRSCANLRFCYLNLSGITEFRYERKNEMNSGLRARFHGGGVPQVGEVTSSSGVIRLSI